MGAVSQVPRFCAYEEYRCFEALVVLLGIGSGLWNTPVVDFPQCYAHLRSLSLLCCGP
jgi:hypothetical protein